jgi:hypothetical protein
MLAPYSGEMSKRNAQPAQSPVSRLERVLGAMVLTTIGLSILCFLAVILGTGLFHIVASDGIWPIVIMLPLVGLPIGFILIVVLIAVNWRARRREAQGGSR